MFNVVLSHIKFKYAHPYGKIWGEKCWNIAGFLDGFLT